MAVCSAKCPKCKVSTLMEGSHNIPMDCKGCNKSFFVRLNTVVDYVTNKMAKQEAAFEEERNNLVKTITEQVEERYKSEKEALEKEKEALENEKEVHEKNKESLETERQLFDEEKKRFGMRHITKTSLKKVDERLMALEEGNEALNQKVDRLNNELDELNKAKESSDEDKKSLFLEMQQKSLTDANKPINQTHNRLKKRENGLKNSITAHQKDSKNFPSDKVDEFDVFQLQMDLSSVEKSFEAMGQEIQWSMQELGFAGESKEAIFKEMKIRLEKIDAQVNIMHADLLLNYMKE